MAEGLQEWERRGRHGVGWRMHRRQRRWQRQTTTLLQLRLLQYPWLRQLLRSLRRVLPLLTFSGVRKSPTLMQGCKPCKPFLQPRKESPQHDE